MISAELGMPACTDRRDARPPATPAGVFFYNASRGNLTALSSLTFLTPMFAALTGQVLAAPASVVHAFGSWVALRYVETFMVQHQRVLLRF